VHRKRRTGSPLCSDGAPEQRLRTLGPVPAVLRFERLSEPIACTRPKSKSRRDGIERAAGRRKLSNISVIGASEHSANLPDGSCDSVLIRGAYHHFTDPAGINGSLFRAVRPGGSVAVVDFRPRFWLGLFVPVRGVPADRGRHGIDPAIVREQFEASGFQFVQLIDPWAGDRYAAVFRKPVSGA